MKVQLIGVNGALIRDRSDFTKFDHHLQGTPQENLIEVAGRTCYDSFLTEKSRATPEYHDHILDVQHGSVLAHSILRVEIPENQNYLWLISFAFRDEKGWYLGSSYFTCNFRFLERIFRQKKIEDYTVKCFLNELLKIAKTEAPLIFNRFSEFEKCDGYRVSAVIKWKENLVTTPQNHNWYSFLISDVSRNFSHEMVRHSYESAISQRSTRYCDETDSKFIHHPYDLKYFSENNRTFKYMLGENLGKKDYKEVMAAVYNGLINDGVDKFTAKKQARGAAARYLPNGIETEMVFTCSERQLGEILEQRVNPAADMEIQGLIAMKEEVAKYLNVPEEQLKLPRIN